MSEETKVQAGDAPEVKHEAAKEEPKTTEKFEELKASAAAAAEGREFNERAALKVAEAEAKAAPVKAAAESVGIQNVVEVIQFGAAVAKAIKEAKANDGKIDFKDVGLLFPVAPLVVPMIDGIGQIPKELGDLDEVEVQALLGEVAKALGSENNAKLVLQIKAGLEFAHAGYKFYKTF